MLEVKERSQVMEVAFIGWFGAVKLWQERIVLVVWCGVLEGVRVYVLMKTNETNETNETKRNETKCATRMWRARAEGVAAAAGELVGSLQLHDD